MNIGLKILYHHHFHQIPVSSSFSGIVVWKLGGWRTFSKYLIDEHLPFLFLSSSVSARVTPFIFQVHILFFNLPLKRFYNSVETVGFFSQSVFENIVIKLDHEAQRDPQQTQRFAFTLKISRILPCVFTASIPIKKKKINKKISPCHISCSSLGSLFIFHTSELHSCGCSLLKWRQKRKLQQFFAKWV